MQKAYELRDKRESERAAIVKARVQRKHSPSAENGFAPVLETPMPPRRQDRKFAPMTGASGRLRVGLDYRPALLSSSGIGRAVRELARALAARPELDLRLFAHSWAPAARSDGIPKAAKLARLPIPGKTLRWLAHLGCGADTLVGGVDVFHWTDYIHPPVARAPIVLTMHDCAFVRDEAFHGPDTEELRNRSQRAIEKAALVVSPTQATADDAVELGLDPKRSTVVPFGIDHIPTDIPDTPPLSRRYLVSVGTIEPRKNHLRLMRAWRQLDPLPQLVLLGRRGWECDLTVQEIERERSTGQLIWRPEATDDEVFHFLRHAQACVYPSLCEGFGFPPLEAAALGTPVLAGDCPALRETLGDAARFCDPTDPLAIQHGLDEITHNNALRTQLRERGPERAREFAWERTASAYAEVYARAAAEVSHP